MAQNQKLLAATTELESALRAAGPGLASQLASRPDSIQLTDKQRADLRTLVAKIQSESGRAAAAGEDAEAFAKIGDGTFLRLLLENLPMLIAILKDLFSKT